jgi:hypothetical protein
LERGIQLEIKNDNEIRVEYQEKDKTIPELAIRESFVIN